MTPTLIRTRRTKTMANNTELKRTLLVRSDEASGYAAKGYTFLAVMQRGNEWYTLLQEPDKPMIPIDYPPRKSSGLLEED